MVEAAAVPVRVVEAADRAVRHVESAAVEERLEGHFLPPKRGCLSKPRRLGEVHMAVKTAAAAATQWLTLRRKRDGRREPVGVG